MIQEKKYFVKGTHCASCELLIERKLLDNFKNIKEVEASSASGEVLIKYEGEKPDLNSINSLFKNDNYSFSEEEQSKEKKGFVKPIIIALAIIIGFYFLNKTGIAGSVNVNSASSPYAFLMLGLIAGISTCAALVGGIVLSMSKQWRESYAKNNGIEKMEPHFMFNAGRIISYTLFGGILGAIGEKLQLSLQFTAFLVFAVSLIMILSALQMLGVKQLRKFQISIPKFLSKKASNESNFKGRYAPFIMGALTFLLPCGFTITAQGIALLSGSAIKGALVMGMFALGTAFPLLVIGLSTIKFSEKRSVSDIFSKTAGIVIIFFALFNINNQLNVLGVSNINDLRKNSAVSEGMAPIVDGKQVIKMNASASGYSPKYFKVKAGVPVRWEITDTGTSGCTNAVISNGLFDGQISLNPGKTSIKEFTPKTAGKYKFSCWMGMVSGTIEVVDPSSSAVVNAASVDEAIPSGAKGCGCASK